MKTTTLAKCIAEGNTSTGHAIIKASGLPPASDSTDMIRKLNSIVSAQKHDPAVLTLFIKAIPETYVPTYNPADGGCKCGGKCGSHNADGNGTADTNPTSWAKEHKTTLIAITAILAFAYIIK